MIKDENDMIKVGGLTTLDLEKSRELSGGDLYSGDGVSVRVIRFNVKTIARQDDAEMLGNELELHLIRELGTDFCGESRKKLRANFCLDFENITYFNSWGFGSLITFDKKYRKVRDKPLVLVNLCPEVSENFRVTRLDQLFKIYDTLQDYQRDLQGAE